MPSIQAWEFIYTRVESTYSPTGISEYQIAFATQGLSQRDLDEIKDQINCFGGGYDTSIVRWQFFAISSGKLALARTQLIRPDPVIIDKDQRNGTYLSHCLLFDAKDFAAPPLHNNPFLLIPGFPVINSPEELRDRYLTQRGATNHCVVEIALAPPSSLQWVRQGNELKELAEAASSQRVRAVEVTGNATQVFNLVEALFRFAAPASRRALSFDTYTEACLNTSKPPVLFGVLNAKGVGSHRINGSGGDLPALQPAPGRKPTLYDAWLTATAAANPNEAYQLAPSIQELALAFEQKRAAIPGVLTSESAESFLRVHKPLVDSQLDTFLRSVVGSGVVQDAFKAQLFASQVDVLTIVESAMTQQPRAIQNYLPEMIERIGMRLATLADEEFANLVVALLMLGGGQHLYRLTQRAGAMRDQRSLQTIERQIQRSSGAEPTFARTVSQRLRQVTPKGLSTMAIAAISAGVVLLFGLIGGGVFLYLLSLAPEVTSIEPVAPIFTPSDDLQAQVIFSRLPRNAQVTAQLERDEVPVPGIAPVAVQPGESEDTIAAQISFAAPQGGWSEGSYSIVLLSGEERLENGQTVVTVALGRLGGVRVVSQPDPAQPLTPVSVIPPSASVVVEVNLGDFRGDQTALTGSISLVGNEEGGMPFILTDFSTPGTLRSGIIHLPGGWPPGQYQVRISYGGQALAETFFTVEAATEPLPTSEPTP